jgi:ferredoxin
MLRARPLLHVFPPALRTQLFEPDDDGLGRPRSETVPAGLEALAQSAVAECPERAIMLTTPA